MQTALRPYATAGVALVGASVIAVSPVTVTQTAAQVRDAGVQLSALQNPIDAFGPVFETAVADLQALGQAIAANPAPILQSILGNLPGNIADLPGNVLAQLLEIPQIPGQLPGQIGASLAGIESLVGPIQTFLQDVITAVVSTDPNAGGVLIPQLQIIFQALQSGDFGTAFGDLSVLPLAPILNPLLNNFMLLPQIAAVFQQQLANIQELLPIASGPLTTAQKIVSVFANDPTALLLVGIGPLLAINGAATAAGNGLSEVIKAIQNGDPEGALNAVITEAANAASSVIGGVVDPNFGLLGGLQHLREEIGAAIGAPLATAAVATVPAISAKSVTLTTPVEKTQADTGASSGEDASGSGGVSTTDPTTGTKESSTDTTSSDNKGDVKGGNLFTPGSTTKGGRHRAENGPSFGQELKDAATKTIKGLTGRGGVGQSEGSKAGTSAGESGSGSSGSSSSSSGSGSK
jgi:hypothetical protein